MRALRNNFLGTLYSLSCLVAAGVLGLCAVRVVGRSLVVFLAFFGGWLWAGLGVLSGRRIESLFISLSSYLLPVSILGKGGIPS